MMGGPVVLALVGYFRGKKIPLTVQTIQDLKPWKLILNSAILYALAYNLVFFVQELFLALGKHRIGLRAFLYHNNHGWEGSDPRTTLLQGAGALAILIAGIFLLAVLLRIRHSNSWLKLFILWLAHHGLIQSLPQLSSAPLARDTDVGQALTYFQMGISIDFTLAYLSIFLIIGLGYLFSYLFLEFAPPGYAISHPFTRFKYILKIVVLPAVIGTIFIFPFRIPPLERYLDAVMLLVVCIPSIFAFSWLIHPKNKIGNEVNHQFLSTPIILLMILLAFFQLVLRPGITFG
jgi:hypothetical protein